MQPKSPFLDLLTGEVNHRYIAGLLAVAALIVHAWIVILLLEPADSEKKTVPVKIMEVAMITQPIPKAVVTPPQPPKALPPKKPVPPKPAPKKKDVPPPVKQKAPVVHKEGDIAKPKIAVKETLIPPPVLTNPFAKTETAVSKPQIAAVSKPAAKTGAADSKGQGVSTGVVELGCPKPKYPARALSRRIEGWVKVEVTISTSGSVTGASVVGSQPAGIFDDAALEATRNCRFKPKLVNGVAVVQKGIKKSTFKLAN